MKTKTIQKIRHFGIVYTGTVALFAMLFLAGALGMLNGGYKMNSDDWKTLQEAGLIFVVHLVPLLILVWYEHLHQGERKRKSTQYNWNRINRI